ncbi:MAG: efflux transporter outer membrane subunit [Pseudomonadota bacterium]|nr:efflux transporter outer membrane subunit [Pseudomonadota bacterium]
MRKGVCVAMAFGLSGCSLTPNYQPPQDPLPTDWRAGYTQMAVSDVALDLDWWRGFADPRLDVLVEEALLYNLDLQLAVARLEEARALLGIARSNQLPRLDGQVSATRQGISDQAASAPGQTVNQFSLAAVLDYELDLWGRLSAANDAARARFFSTAAARDAVHLAVAADTASLYFSVRALSQQLEIAEATVGSRTEALQLRAAQWRNGAIAELALRQAEAELAAARAQVPVIAERLGRERRALAVLVGRDPAGVVKAGETAVPSREMLQNLTRARPEVPMGLPSDLLERRPDIQAAHLQLLAANSDIGVARAARLPRISLTGLLGLQSASLEDWLSGSARTWQIGAGADAPIFDFGRSNQQVAASEARRRQAEVRYQQVVRLAFQEVADALSARHYSAQQLAAQDAQLAALRETVRLANARYTAGYSSYLEVLDSERTLFDVALARVTTEQRLLAATVDLFKTLGGGWHRKEARADGAVLAEGQSPGDAATP